MPARALIPPRVRQRAGLEVLTWPVFDSLPVDALVTTRHGGVSRGPYATLNLSFSVGDDPAHVVENRQRAAAALAGPVAAGSAAVAGPAAGGAERGSGAGLTEFVFAHQVHGNTARIVTAADRGAGAFSPDDAIPDTDALVTADPGTVLAVLAADCVPILLYDPHAHVLACVHAGWRGTVARTAGAALTAMCSLGAQPARVIAALGPAIAPGRYQVGGDVAAQVSAAFSGEAGQVLRPQRPGRWLLDLWAANRIVLAGAGVPQDQIHLPAVATGGGDGLFFSHRAQQPCGRFALLARLRERGDQ